MSRVASTVCSIAVLLVCLTPEGAAQDGRSAPIGSPARQGRYLGQEPPGDAPELFAPGLISTGREHSSALFAAGGREIWFARMQPAALWVTRQVDGRWSSPEPARLSPEWGYLYPCVAPDGNAVVFTSDMPAEAGRERLRPGEGDMWKITRTDAGWSEPEHLGQVVNLGQLQACGSISARGTLFFSSRIDGASGRTQGIYDSRLVDGRHAEPRKLAVSSDRAPDHSPFVAPDESYMIFSSFRGGVGLSDLFISFKGAEGEWTRPRSMGRTINTAAKEEFPYVTPDGEYLFFNSNRISSLNSSRIPDGPGNIYWVSARIIERLRFGSGNMAR